jgi:hypothetical protein
VNRPQVFLVGQQDIVATVYAFFAGDQPLYVGCTASLTRRLRVHQGKPWWPDVTRIDLASFTSRDEALEHEAKLISELRPSHNAIHNGARALRLVAARVCQGCGEELPPPKQTGRPRQWCSAACFNRRFGTTCITCGTPTTQRRRHCVDCAPRKSTEWSYERIIGAIQEWHASTGAIPQTRDWKKGAPDRPTVGSVTRAFGSWNAAIAAAGFTPQSMGGPRPKRSP